MTDAWNTAFQPLDDLLPTPPRNDEREEHVAAALLDDRIGRNQARRTERQIQTLRSLPGAHHKAQVSVHHRKTIDRVPWNEWTTRQSGFAEAFRHYVHVETEALARADALPLPGFASWTESLPEWEHRAILHAFGQPTLSRLWEAARQRFREEAPPHPVPGNGFQRKRGLLFTDLEQRARIAHQHAILKTGPNGQTGEKFGEAFAYRRVWRELLLATHDRQIQKLSQWAREMEHQSLRKQRFALPGEQVTLQGEAQGFALAETLLTAALTPGSTS